MPTQPSSPPPWIYTLPGLAIIIRIPLFDLHHHVLYPARIVCMLTIARIVIEFAV